MFPSINSVKDGLVTALYALIVVVLVLSLPKVISASQTLLERAGSINTIEVEGVKIAFDQGSVSTHLDGFSYLTPAAKATVLQKIKGLEPEEFERLMGVGELADLCDFDHPTVDMRRSIALDFQLNDKGLTAITVSPHLRAAVDEKIKSGEITSGKASDIGYPRSCYFMKYTDVGRDTKTAIVKILSSAFVQTVASK